MSTKPKFDLDTVEKILAWAKHAPADVVQTRTWPYVASSLRPADTETAEYIAACVKFREKLWPDRARILENERMRRAFDAHEAQYREHRCGSCDDRWEDDYCTCTEPDWMRVVALRRAIKGESK